MGGQIGAKEIASSSENNNKKITPVNENIPGIVEVTENNATEIAKVKNTTKEKLTEEKIRQKMLSSEKALKKANINPRKAVEMVDFLLKVSPDFNKSEKVSNKYGVYDKSFVEVLIAYQKANKLTPDGILGNETLALVLLEKRDNLSGIEELSTDKDIKEFVKAKKEGNVTKELLKRLSKKAGTDFTNGMGKFKKSGDKKDITPSSNSIIALSLYSDFEAKHGNEEKYKEVFENDKILDPIMNIMGIDTTKNENGEESDKVKKIKETIHAIAGNKYAMVAAFIGMLMFIFGSRGKFATIGLVTMGAIFAGGSAVDLVKKIGKIWGKDSLPDFLRSDNGKIDSPSEIQTKAVAEQTETSVENSKRNINTVNSKILIDNQELGKNKLEPAKINKIQEGLTKYPQKYNEFLELNLNSNLKTNDIILMLGLKEFFKQNKIEEKDFKTYLILLKKQAKTGDINYGDIYKNILKKETETSSESTENKVDKIPLNDIFIGLDKKINKFRNIAKKTENLENVLGVAWNEEENIKKYKGEIFNKYSDIQTLVEELKKRLDSNSLSDSQKNNIENKINEIYLFLAEFYSDNSENLENDHLRDYDLSNINALAFLVSKNLIDTNKYPDLVPNSLINNIEKFEIDLEKLIDDLEDSNNPNIRKAISILEDNIGIGIFDFNEKNTDSIINNSGSIVAGVIGTGAIVMSGPIGWGAMAAIAGSAGVAGASINTVTRGESDLKTFAGEVGITAFQAGTAGAFSVLGASAIAKSTSIWISAGIISAEVAGDVLVVGMLGDGIRSFVYDYEYNLGESFEQNLIWAPLVLLGSGGGAIKKSLEKAKLMKALGNSKGAIQEIKYFNKTISSLKQNIIGKKYSIDIDGKKYNVKIDDSGKIETNIVKADGNTEIKVLDPKNKEDTKIIKKLAKEIQKQSIDGNILKPKNTAEAKNIFKKKKADIEGFYRKADSDDVLTKKTDGKFYNKAGQEVEAKATDLEEVKIKEYYIDKKDKNKKYLEDEKGNFYDTNGKKVDKSSLDIKPINFTKLKETLNRLKPEDYFTTKEKNIITGKYGSQIWDKMKEGYNSLKSELTKSESQSWARYILSGSESKDWMKHSITKIGSGIVISEIYAANTEEKYFEEFWTGGHLIELGYSGLNYATFGIVRGMLFDYFLEGDDMVEGTASSFSEYID